MVGLSVVVGDHVQRSTGRLLRYWAAFDPRDDGVQYHAVITENDGYLSTPHFLIEGAIAGRDPARSVREHLSDYMDAMVFGRPVVPVDRDHRCADPGEPAVDADDGAGGRAGRQRRHAGRGR